MPEIHLHVGLPKTGTSTIQGALDSRVAALRAAGVLYPGSRHRAQRIAAYDLLGQRVRGDDADIVPGAFRRLVDEVVAYDGPRVLISDEELGMARPRHVRRVVRLLGADDVHVVVSVRDLARTVVSAWQQNVMGGSTTSWGEFIAAVRDPDAAGPAVPDATAFWLRHDVLRVLDAWGAMVPLDRIRVVTVPPPGTDGRCLLDRFAEATGLPTDLWDGPQPRRLNVSLGAAEGEVVRRLNAVVGPLLNQEQHRFVVEQGLRPRLAVARSRPLRLPGADLAWAVGEAEGLVEQLRQRAVHVVGDLADLVPDHRVAVDRPFDQVTDAELREAAEAALAALAVGHGRLFRRYRREFREREGRLPSAHEVVGSSLRAASFGAQKAALRRTGRSRLLARIARAYVVRTSGRRTPVDD
jgi:hypothetical protein